MDRINSDLFQRSAFRDRQENEFDKKEPSRFIKSSKVKQTSIGENLLLEQKIKSIYQKYFILEQCPKSLKLIVVFYR